MARTQKAPPCAGKLCAMHMAGADPTYPCDDSELAPVRCGQAITVEFVTPTNANLNPRWRARCYASSLVREQDDDQGPDVNAFRAAVALATKLGWNPHGMRSGGAYGGGYVFLLP